MRHLVLFFVLLGCSGTQIYPPGNFHTADAGTADAGLRYDENGNLIGLGVGGNNALDASVGEDEDASNDVDSAVALDGGGAGGASGGGGGAGGDAGAPITLGGLCDACTVDAECKPCHVCVYRSADKSKSCEPQSTTQSFPECTDRSVLFTSAPYVDTHQIAVGAAQTTYYQKGVRNAMTCAEWVAAYKP